MKTDLSGKIAVVTGAGGVLCSRFAVALAQSGAKVALLNRTLAKAEKIEELRKEMAKAVKEERYEDAGKLKKQIQKLEAKDE